MNKVQRPKTVLDEYNMGIVDMQQYQHSNVIPLPIIN